jgi:uncharacterized membrane protein
MLNMILAALMGAFILAFAVRMTKSLVVLIYDLAPFVMFVIGLLAFFIMLDKYVAPQENDEGSIETVQDTR